MTHKDARKELLAAVEDFDVNARTANVRLANAIEDIIKIMLSEHVAVETNATDQLPIASSDKSA